MTWSFYFPQGRPLKQTGSVAKSFKLKDYLGNKSFSYNTVFVFEWMLSRNSLRPWKKTIHPGSRQITQCFWDRVDACGSGGLWMRMHSEMRISPFLLSCPLPCCSFKAPKAPLWRKLRDSWVHAFQSLVKPFHKYVLWSTRSSKEIEFRMVS